MPGYFTCNCMVTWSFAQGEDRRLAVHYDVVNVPETINANEPWGITVIGMGRWNSQKGFIGTGD